jgi:hypothetical protein
MLSRTTVLIALNSQCTRVQWSTSRPQLSDVVRFATVLLATAGPGFRGPFGEGHLHAAARQGAGAGLLPSTVEHTKRPSSQCHMALATRMIGGHGRLQHNHTGCGGLRVPFRGE